MIRIASSRSIRSCLLFLSACAVRVFLGQTPSPAAELSGTVKTARGAELSQVRIKLSADGGSAPLRATVTDGKGHYIFHGVPYGTYTLSSELPGYTPVHKEKLLISSAAVILDLNVIEAEGTGFFAAESGPSSEQALPTFRPSEIQGTIAPSGYSSAASAEELSHVRDYVADLEVHGAPASGPQPAQLNCAGLRDLQRTAESEPTNFEVNRKLGLLYLASSQPTSSIRYLSLAQKLHASDPEIKVDLATAYLHSGNSEEAISLLRQVSRSNPTDLRAIKLLASAYAASGKFVEAADAFRAALALNGSENNVLECSLGLINSQDTDDAARVLTAAVVRYSQSPRMWFGLALAQSEQERKPDAIASLFRATELDPAYEPAFGLLANLVGTSQQTDRETLRQQFSRLTAQPNSASAHYDYALSLWNSEKGSDNKHSTATVIAQLELAIQKEPRLFRPHYQLGVVYASAHNDARAMLEFEQVTVLAPDFAEAHYRLSQAYRRSGRLKEANQELAVFQELRSIGVSESEQPPAPLPETSSANSSRLAAPSCPDAERE